MKLYRKKNIRIAPEVWAQMTFRKRKWLAFFVVATAMVFALTGCKASKKKVLESTYYKELKKENNKLKKENKALQSKVDAENDVTEEEQRSSDYLEKITRDTLVKLEVGYADDMESSTFVEDKAVFSAATAIAERADRTTKYTPEEVEKLYGPGYEYILYDEDNAVYEVMVYGGNYVVFTDLPNNVYYVYNASEIGDAFVHFKNGYPNSKLMHRLADTPLITSKTGKYYENDVAFSAANFIDQMSKKKSTEARAKKKWGKKTAKKLKNGKSYTFYHHGNTMNVTIYDEYFSIRNMNGKTTWYHAEKATVKKLKNIFKTKKTSSDTGSEKDDESDTAQEHYDEIETSGDSN